MPGTRRVTGFLHCKREDGTLYADILDKYMTRVAQAEPGDVVGLRYAGHAAAMSRTRGFVASDEYIVAATPAGVGLVDGNTVIVAGSASPTRGRRGAWLCV